MTVTAPSADANAADRRWMRVALALGRRGVGLTWPNPAVGCVLVRDGTVVGRGWTQPGGRPHAETEALARAGEAAAGATAYVSLEPCSHHGKTPPCAEALIGAGVARVVMACRDPDARVDGAGQSKLSEAGIAVTAGVLEAAARSVNEGFFQRARSGRPFVSLKVATSLDGRIATGAGHSQWITGDAARAQVHRLRAAHDAVLTGMGTVRADDPRLTVRLPGLPVRAPVRVVLARQEHALDGTALAATAGEGPVWLVVPEGSVSAARGGDIRILRVPPDERGWPDVSAALHALAAEGITRVMIESGATLAASALRARLIDRIYWFRAPNLIGGDGHPVVEAIGVDNLEGAPRFARQDTRAAGDDQLEVYDFDSAGLAISNGAA